MKEFIVDFFSCYCTANNIENANEKLKVVHDLLSENLQKKSNIVDAYKENNGFFVENVFELEFFSHIFKAENMAKAIKQISSEFPVHLGFAIEEGETIQREEIKPTLKGFDDCNYTLNEKKLCEHEIYVEEKQP